jgi:hypothetical protein
MEMVVEDRAWGADAPLDESAEDELVSGIMTFTPAESKRLIAKAVVAMKPVRRALEKGRVIVASGTTNAYIAEEILGRSVPRQHYIKGNISHGLLCSTGRSEEWIKPYVLVDGAPVSAELADAVKEFDAGDVFIKGANAVDADGNAGILLANSMAGTIGAALGAVTARGSHLIVPVGLEKLVPSVIAASRKAGIKRLKYPSGGTVGFMPVVGATTVTEIEALSILAGVEATHVASGGIAGCEGSVVLVVEGPDSRVRAAFELWEGIKGEAPIPASPATIRYGVDARSG